MAIVPDESPTSAPDVDFGANDWLLEEMYEQYTADPSSVDETWAKYFKSHAAPSVGAGDGAAAENRSQGPGLPRSPQRAVVSRPQRQQPCAGARAGLARPPAAARSRPRPVARRQLRSPRQPRRYGRRAGSAGAVPADPRAMTIGQTSHSKSQSRPPCGDFGTHCQEHGRLLDGAYRDQRSIATGQAAHRPARVINNHLRRARGGKVSYTHMVSPWFRL